MSVYVDEIRKWPHAKHPFLNGSCHLTADTLDELHAFAVGKLKMKREWFQDHPIAAHYDLTPGRRADALKHGAIFVPARQQSQMRRRKKEET